MVFLDSTFPQNEQLPLFLEVTFTESIVDNRPRVTVATRDFQIGDCITDNCYTNNNYRYHDIFHLANFSILGWSPCLRKMLGKKRKSNPLVDEIEDGARAIIAEEAVCAIIFDYGKKLDFAVKEEDIDPSIVSLLRSLTSDFEVSVRTEADWRHSIAQSFLAWNAITQNRGGSLKADRASRTLKILPIETREKKFHRGIQHYPSRKLNLPEKALKAKPLHGNPRVSLKPR